MGGSSAKAAVLRCDRAVTFTPRRLIASPESSSGVWRRTLMSSLSIPLLVFPAECTCGEEKRASSRSVHCRVPLVARQANNCYAAEKKQKKPRLQLIRTLQQQKETHSAVTSSSLPDFWFVWPQPQARANTLTSICSNSLLEEEEEEGREGYSASSWLLAVNQDIKLGSRDFWRRLMRLELMVVSLRKKKKSPQGNQTELIIIQTDARGTTPTFHPSIIC